MTAEGVRRGGRAVLPTGELIVWSIADGRRGRRWREVASVAGTVVQAVLLEADPTGRLVRLEVATAAGLLTLHPDLDNTVLHGNVVTPAGVRHLSFDRTTVLLDRSPAAMAVAIVVAAARLTAGAPAEDATGDAAKTRVDLVWVDDRLEPRMRTWAFSSMEGRTWRLVDLSAPDGGGGADSSAPGTPGITAAISPTEHVVQLDDHGLPILSGDAWPLQV